MRVDCDSGVEGKWGESAEKEWGEWVVCWWVLEGNSRVWVFGVESLLDDIRGMEI